jgi:type VI secretion system (T6SS) effector TldE1-like protein
MPDPYANERGEPVVQQCTQPRSAYWLLFDGYYLKLHLGQRLTQAWHARSGSSGNKGVFDYTPARQSVKRGGPIPEGEYWIQPDELATRPSALEFWRGSWNEAAWGEQRITVHPRPQTATLGRGGFFIHGGTNWGSAGCIDLTYGMTSFAKAVSPLTGCHLPVKVDYRGTTLVPVP